MRGTEVLQSRNENSLYYFTLTTASNLSKPRKMSQTASDTEIITPVSSTETDPLTTDSLKQLQSKDERRLLDVVDKLRRTGLDGTIELPQLVVCGDQSSGKSSVLEAVSTLNVISRDRY
jgi:hypothetical protein